MISIPPPPAVTPEKCRICLMRRYLYGYKINDEEYNQIIKEFTNKIRDLRDQNLVMKELINYFGRYNIITKTAYETAITKYLSKRFHRPITNEILNQFIFNYYHEPKTTAYI